MPSADRTWREEVPHPELPRGKDTIPQIKHIVILMMQGHSYDNYLGLNVRGDGFPLDDSGLPLGYNLAYSGERIKVHHLSSTVQRVDAPADTARASDIQWNGGASDGFVRSVQLTSPGASIDTAMGYWTADDLPFINSLAEVFPIADRWFSSCLGPGLPNRRFLVAGTGAAHDYPPNGTVFNLLTANGISWVNYQSNATPREVAVSRIFGLPGLKLGRRIGRMLTAVSPFLLPPTLGLPKYTADVFPITGLSTLTHVRPLADFFADASAGALPSVSVVDPDFGVNSGQPPQDVRASENFTAKVVNSLMYGKGWPQTLLIWLHDGWGGYYDHVPPPPAVSPEEASADSGFDAYGRLGFRVPAIIVSPYARRDYVSNMIFDHASVLKLIEIKWNLPALTRRDYAADAPLDMIDLDSEPAFLSPPKLAAPAAGALRPSFRIDASPAFIITSTPELGRSLISIAGAWAIGFVAFGGSSFWFQAIVLLAFTVLAIQGIRGSGFWRQWIFWRPPRYLGITAVYNAVFAFITLSVFYALVSSELYRYGVFRLAEARMSGNSLWMFTVTYFWNLINAIPGLEITSTLRWDSPLHFSNIWGELFIILFRLLALGPLLSVLAQALRSGGPFDSSRQSESA